MKLIYMDRVKRIWYLSPMRAAKVQASLRIRAVSPEPSLLAHTSNESRGTFRQKARSLALQNGWACAVKICHDGMLEDTNSLDGAHMQYNHLGSWKWNWFTYSNQFNLLIYNLLLNQTELAQTTKQLTETIIFKFFKKLLLLSLHFVNIENLNIPTVPKDRCATSWQN